MPELQYVNSILRKKVCLIDDFTLIPEMVEKMYETRSVENRMGLVENSLDWIFNLLTIYPLNYDEEGHSCTFVNAEILQSEGEIIMEEGCLSFPNMRVQIKWPESIML